MVDRRPDTEVIEGLERERGRRWPWVLGALVLIVLGWLLLRGSSSDEEGWSTAPVSSGPLVLHVTAVGPLKPLEEVDVGSDLSGVVASVEVEENQAVQAGQVLARLDSEPFELAVAEARARTASARAGIEQARVELRGAELALGRARSLHDQRVVSEVELEAAEIRHDAALAGLSAAKANLALALASLKRVENDLAETVITSPIDGVVLRRQVEPGQTVVSMLQASTLFVVASDLSQLSAALEVDEADVGRVEAGQHAGFTVTAWPGRDFEGRVHEVDLAPSLSSVVVVYVAELWVDNPDLALRPGMTATATIETERHEAVLRVPSEALRFRPMGVEALPGSQVWVLEDDEPVALSVDVLGSDGSLTALSSTGLREGDQVLIGR